MANDPILHLLGLAKKAGRLEIGEEPVGALCRARHARLILLASDAAPNTRRRCAHFGEIGNVLWLELPATKAELGFCLGRTSCAMLALRRGLCRLHCGKALRPRPGALWPRRPAAADQGRPDAPAPAGKTSAREKPAGGQAQALGSAPPAQAGAARQRFQDPGWPGPEEGPAPPSYEAAPPRGYGFPRQDRVRPAQPFQQARPRRPTSDRQIPARFLRNEVASPYDDKISHPQGGQGL